MLKFNTIYILISYCQLKTTDLPTSIEINALIFCGWNEALTYNFSIVFIDMIVLVVDLLPW